MFKNNDFDMNITVIQIKRPQIPPFKKYRTFTFINLPENLYYISRINDVPLLDDD